MQTSINTAAMTMKPATTQLITCPLLAFLIGAVAAYLVYVEPWTSTRDSDDAVSVSTIENPPEPTPEAMPATKDYRPGPEKHPEVGGGKGPTLAFPTVLPPLPRGHIIEVGVELGRSISQ